VHVGEEQIVERERDPVTHHLALRSLPAIEQDRFSFPYDREGANPPFHGGTGGGGSEETDEQRHGGNIGGSADSPVPRLAASPLSAVPYSVRSGSLA
jgi:hypothetical protein